MGDDAISRSHLDDRIRRAAEMVEDDLTDDFKDGVLSALEIIETEPSVQPMSRWIPTSERMPEYGEFYLCSCDDGIVICEYLDKFVHPVLGHFAQGDVKAWMPLPEPFRAEPKTEKGRLTIDFNSLIVRMINKTGESGSDCFKLEESLELSTGQIAEITVIGTINRSNRRNNSDWQDAEG